MRILLIVLDCALWLGLGGMLAYSGVHINSVNGGIVWALLLAITLVRAQQTVVAYRKGVRLGAVTAVRVMIQQGWTKN